MSTRETDLLEHGDPKEPPRWWRWTVLVPAALLAVVLASIALLTLRPESSAPSVPSGDALASCGDAVSAPHPSQHRVATMSIVGARVCRYDKVAVAEDTVLGQAGRQTLQAALAKVVSLPRQHPVTFCGPRWGSYLMVLKDAQGDDWSILVAPQCGGQVFGVGMHGLFNAEALLPLLKAWAG